MDLRSLRQRLTALADKVPAPATAPAEQPITPEQRQAMDALEGELLARVAPFDDAADEALAQRFLRTRRVCREADAHARRPFRLTYGIEVSPSAKGNP